MVQQYHVHQAAVSTMFAGLCILQEPGLHAGSVSDCIVCVEDQVRYAMPCSCVPSESARLAAGLAFRAARCI